MIEKVAWSNIVDIFLGYSVQLHSMAFAIMAVCLVFGFKQVNNKPSGVWNVALMLCLFAFTLRVLLVDSSPKLAHIFNSVEYLTPVFFMICVRVNFDDDFVFSWVEKCAVLVVGSLAFLFAIREFIGTSEVMYTFQMRSQFVLDGLAVLWAYWCVIRTWAVDLDPYRRTARVYFVTGCGPVVAVVLTLYFISVDQGLPFAHCVDMFVSGAIVVLGLMAIAFFTDVKRGLFGRVRKVTPEVNVPLDTPPQEAVNVLSDMRPVENAEVVGSSDTTEKASQKQAFLDTLEQVMNGQGRFQEMGITLASLAKYTAIPEYRLRGVINQDLGYRNFNAYVNHYRVAYARELLEDKECSKSILDISMDCGYKSLSTFNKAFKDITSLTPSEYRKKRVLG